MHVVILPFKSVMVIAVVQVVSRRRPAAARIRSGPVSIMICYIC